MLRCESRYRYLTKHLNSWLINNSVINIGFCAQINTKRTTFRKQTIHAAILVRLEQDLRLIHFSNQAVRCTTQRVSTVVTYLTPTWRKQQHIERTASKEAKKSRILPPSRDSPQALKTAAPENEAIDGTESPWETDAMHNSQAASRDGNSRQKGGIMQNTRHHYHSILSPQFCRLQRLFQASVADCCYYSFLQAGVAARTKQA